MSWRQNLQRGSFRGVEFFTNSVESSYGRRVVTHEYPLRDTPYSEDLGHKAKEFSIECYVVGEDYMTDRDALLGALRKKGGGTLIHPFMGEMWVQVLTVSVREGSAEEGIARFNISFIDAGKNEAPNVSDDTKGIVDDAAEEVKASAINDFVARFDINATSEFVRDEVRSVIGHGFNTVMRLPSFNGEIPDIEIDIKPLMQYPEMLANEIQTAISQVTDVVDLRVLEKFGNDLTLIPQTTKTRLKQMVNQQAVVDLVQTLVLAEKARLLVKL